MVTPFVGDAGLGDQSTSSPCCCLRAARGRDWALPSSYEACAAAAVLTAEGAAIADAAKRPALTPADSLIAGLAGERSSRAGRVVGRAARDSAGSGVSEPSRGRSTRRRGSHPWRRDRGATLVHPSSARSAWKSPVAPPAPEAQSRLPRPRDDGGGRWWWGGSTRRAATDDSRLSPHGDLPHGQGE